MIVRLKGHSEVMGNEREDNLANYPLLNNIVIVQSNTIFEQNYD